MKIQQMDRKSMRLVSERMIAALEPLGKELGISFKDRGGKFDYSYGIFKIEGAVIGSNGKTKGPEVVDFETYASSFGLKKSDLGKSFVSPSGHAFKIIGLAPRRTKRPIIAQKIPNGGKFVFEAEVVKKALEQQHGQ